MLFNPRIKPQYLYIYFGFCGWIWNILFMLENYLRFSRMFNEVSVSNFEAVSSISLNIIIVFLVN